MTSTTDIDQLFHALSDPTRRDILRTVLVEDRSVSQLADGYPMSFAAVQKHVAVLERAGLVTKRAAGRERLVRGNPEALGRADRVLEELEGLWRGRLARMQDVLSDPTTTIPDEGAPR